MKRSLSILMLLSIAMTSVAYAHAHLEKSQPAANSTVTAPKEVTLEFNEAVQLTSLTLQKGDEKAEELKPLPKDPAAKIVVPVPKVVAGKYIIKWRAVSDDNHIMSGKVLFTVSGQ